MQALLSPQIDPAVHHFLNVARSHPPLDGRTERQLLARSRAGDGEAVDRLVDANLRYVVDLAVIHEDSWEGLDLADLCSEGACALVVAVRQYDERRDGPFRSHLIARIHRAMASAEC